MAGNRTITIDHGGGLKTSYLLETASPGAWRVVARRGNRPLGMSHGSDALHFSVRIDGVYVDPMTVLGCRPVDLTKALWLLPPPPGS